MKIYVMDRDYYFLKQTDELLAEMGYERKCFSYLYQLTVAVTANQPDALLIESEIPSVLGFADSLRQKYPKLKWILTGNSGALTAEQLNFQPDGWLPKPATKEKLEEQLFRAMHPVLARMRRAAEQGTLKRAAT